MQRRAEVNIFFSHFIHSRLAFFELLSCTSRVLESALIFLFGSFCCVSAANFCGRGSGARVKGLLCTLLRNWLSFLKINPARWHAFARSWRKTKLTFTPSQPATRLITAWCA